MKKGLLLAAFAIVGCIAFMSCQSSGPKKTAESVAAFPVAVEQCGFSSLAAAQSWASSMLLVFQTTYPQVRSPKATFEPYYGPGMHEHWCASVGGNVIIL